MDVSIRVPAGMQAISVGRLESSDSGNEKDSDTWHWIARQPMATYLNFITIGHYEMKQGIDHGLPYVYAVSDKLPPDQRKVALAAMMTTGERIRTLERMFGPYPFTELGGVVPAHRLWFGGLETQTRPVYEREIDPEPQLRAGPARPRAGPHVVRRQRDRPAMERHLRRRRGTLPGRSGEPRRTALAGRKANDSLNRAYRPSQG